MCLYALTYLQYECIVHILYKYDYFLSKISVVSSKTELPYAVGNSSFRCSFLCLKPETVPVSESSSIFWNFQL
jgi:hypothetical protein